jgi:hypothetical protein
MIYDFRKILFLFLAFPLTLSAQKMIHQGQWRGVLQLNDSTELPFNFVCEFQGITQTLVIKNGKEKIIVDEIIYDGDSVFINFPLFRFADPRLLRRTQY